MGVFVFLLAACGCRADGEEASSNTTTPEEDAILYQPSGLYRGELTKVNDTCAVTLKSMWEDSRTGIYPSLGFNGYEAYLASDALSGTWFKIPYIRITFAWMDFQTGKKKGAFLSERVWGQTYKSEPIPPQFKHLQETWVCPAYG